MFAVDWQVSDSWTMTTDFCRGSVRTSHMLDSTGVVGLRNTELLRALTRLLLVNHPGDDSCNTCIVSCVYDLVNYMSCRVQLL